MFFATKVSLLRQKLSDKGCCDKICFRDKRFVATSILLLRQKSYLSQLPPMTVVCHLVGYFKLMQRSFLSRNWGRRARILEALEFKKQKQGRGGGGGEGGGGSTIVT